MYPERSTFINDYVIISDEHVNVTDNSRVLLCENVNSNKIYRMKVIDRNKITPIMDKCEDLMHESREVAALVSVSPHENITTLKEVVDNLDHPFLYIILENANLISLKEVGYIDILEYINNLCVLCINI